MMPVAIKLFHTEADAVRWFAGTDVAELWMWRFLMPMVVLGGFLVPQMGPRTFGDCGVGWLPLVLELLLILGSALHLCSLGYVYSILWNTVHALPVIWAATWLIWWRRVEWAPEGNEVQARRSILVPGLFGVLPFFMPVSDTLFILNLINLLFCAGMFLRMDRSAEIQAVATLALVGMLKSIPSAMLAGPLVGTSRVQLLMLVGSAGVFAFAVFKRTPGWGIATAISVVFPLSHFWLTGNADWPVVGQIALLVWWTHSLRWDTSRQLARALQTTGFVVWCWQSTLWFLRNGGEGAISLALMATVIPVTAGIMIWQRGGARYWVFCVISLLIIGLNGVSDLVSVLRRVPSGLLMLLVGLALFGVGTLSAHWRKQLTLSGQDSELIERDV